MVVQYRGAVLAVAATWAKTDPMFLKRRSRRRWWKRGVFPRVPGDTVQEAREEVPAGTFAKVRERERESERERGRESVRE
jgi:hypothetical protein